MLFNTPRYIFLFLPLVALVYFGLNSARLTMAGKFWLVLSSLFFYGYWNPSYLLLITVSILANFGTGRSLQRFRKFGKDRASSRKSVLIAGIVFNLGLLGYFKYADFLVSNFAWALALDLPTLNIVLPLAISFFTFQQIAYLVDCYQTDTQEYNFLNYCLFVTFFPQLIAGPIVHHAEMMPQFMRHRNLALHWNNIALGVTIFFIGLFKKVVIADTFAVWANAGFDADGLITQLDAWASSLSYTFQLYYDFSGYTDMAIGAALLFNIRLPINFNSPYKALDIRDFWRRWHMTLSRWFRGYVYIPLGGNRKGDIRILSNLFITFLLAGFWHGAGWTFVIWGSMHGVALVVHRLWKKAGICMPALAGWFITFIFVDITWVFFRADSIGDAIRIITRMFSLPEKLIFSDAYAETINSKSLLGFISDSPGQIGIYVWLPLFIFAMIALLAPNGLEQTGFVRGETRFLFRPDYKHAFIVAVLIFSSILTFFGDVSPNEFLYFNF